MTGVMASAMAGVTTGETTAETTGERTGATTGVMIAGTTGGRTGGLKDVRRSGPRQAGQRRGPGGGGVDDSLRRLCIWNYYLS